MPLTGDSGASQEKVEKLAGPLLEEYLHIKVRMTMMIFMEIDMIFCTLSSYYETPNIIILYISGS